MLFMVLGVIGPGLFQLQPPQWFGAPGTGHDGALTAEAPAKPAPKTFTLPDANAPANIESPALTTGEGRADAVEAATEVAAADDPDIDSLKTDGPSSENLSSEKLVSDGPAIESTPSVPLPDVDEDSPPVTAAMPATPAAPAPAIIGNIGRPRSTDVWCPHDIGREGWEWVGQESEVCSRLNSAHKVRAVAGVFPLSEV